MSGYGVDVDTLGCQRAKCGENSAVNLKSSRGGPGPQLSHSLFIVT